MKKYLLYCSFLIALFDISCSSDSTGPDEGGPIFVSSLAIGSSNEVFITTNERLLKSPDNGETWDRINSIDFRWIAVSPEGIIYGLTTVKNGLYNHDERLWCSTDSGRTFSLAGWNRTNTFSGLSWLAFDNFQNIYASEGIPGTLYRNWSVIWYNSTASLKCFIVPGSIFLTLFDGVYRGRPGGGNWTKVLDINDNTGTYTYTEGALAYDPEGRIFAAVSVSRFDDSVKTGMIFLSENNGDSWIMSAALNSPVTDLAVNSDGKIYAITERHEVLSSEDNGYQWTKVSENFPESTVYQFIISPNHILYIRTSDRLYRSRDDGITWEEIKVNL